MFTAILILIAILAVLLILVVLIQNSKGGLSQTMGTASSQLIGVKKTTDILEKATWGLAISIMILCMISNFALDRTSTGNEELNSAAIENAQENTAPQAAPEPAATSKPGDSVVK